MSDGFDSVSFGEFSDAIASKGSPHFTTEDERP